MEHLILELLGTPRGRCVVGALAIAGGVVFCAIAWPDVRGEWKLKQASATAHAEVVDTQVSRTEHGRQCYDVKYRFRTSERGPWFTREEPGTGRTALWTELPKREWDRARATGWVEVVYLSEDPHLNRPAATRSSSMTDSVAGLVMGLLMLVGGSVLLVVSVARWHMPHERTNPAMREAPRAL